MQSTSGARCAPTRRNDSINATIRTLLDAAVWAPTAVHEEPWAFVVVQDIAVLKSLSDRAKTIFAADARVPTPIKRAVLLETAREA